MSFRYTSDIKNQKYDAIIIGSGMGGLTCASLLARNGKKVLVLERHYVLGGFTHCFKRKRFKWDVGLHYVGQIGDENSVLRKAFDYITDYTLHWGRMDEIYDRAIIGSDKYVFFSDREKQKTELKSKFPEEGQAIDKYYKLLEDVVRPTMMFFGEKTMPLPLSKYVGWMLRKQFQKYATSCTYDVLRQYTHNQRLIAVLTAQCGNYGLPPKSSSYGVHNLIAGHFSAGGFYPAGGAEKIPEKIIKIIEAHGGRVAINSEVQGLLLKGKKVAGVRLTNGDVIQSKYVISNVGAYNSYKHLVPPEFGADVLSELGKIPPSTDHIGMYIGLNKSDTELNLPKCNYWLYKSDDFDKDYDEYLKRPDLPPPLFYVSFPSARDPYWTKTYPDRSTIQVIVPFNIDWVKQWEDSPWMKRGAEYHKVKKKLEEIMMKKVLEIVPQIKGHVEHVELSSPLSTKKFTNYQSGEIYGLAHSPERFQQKWLRPHTPIKNFFLTGQDILTVGAGSALFSGIITATSVLKKNMLLPILRTKPKDGQIIE